ncbi:MAG: sugar ABC transporter substrate-binding protein [Spirochaetota bacterium]
MVSWKKTVSLVLLLYLLPQVAFGAAVEVVVNGEHWSSFNTSQLKSLSYPIPESLHSRIINPSESEKADRTEGISLQELLPLFADAWRLEVGGEKVVLMEDSQLSEQLATLFYRLEDTQLTLHVTGEVLAEPAATVWVSWEGTDELKAEIQRFAQLHNADIEVLEVPNISAKLRQTHKAGGEVPDVVMVQSDYIYELSGGGMLQPLDYLDVDQYGPKGLKAFTLNTRQWAVPFYLDTQLMIAREDILSEAGWRLQDVKTLSDFEQLLISVKQHSEAAPASWNVYSAYWLLPFQFGFGKAYLVEPDKSVVVNDKASLEAVTYLLSLMESDLLVPFERDAMFSKFVSGQCALMLSSSYMLPELERLEIPFSVAPFPVNESTGSAVAPLLDYKGLAIPKKSRNPIVAKRLIDYLGGIGIQQRFPKAVHKLPSHKEVTLTDSPYHEVLTTSVERGTTIVPDVGYAVYKNIMWKLLRTIITGELSAREGLDKAQQLISAQLSDVFEDFQTKGDTKDEDGDTDEDAAASSGGGFFTWLRNLWN